VSNTLKDGIRRGSVRLEAALSRLDRLVDWERRARSGPEGRMERSLEPVRGLCARLGHPERTFAAVHVAGSKGKGTSASLVAGALGAAGVRTALYASPHVVRVNERLKIGGMEIADEHLAAVLERVLAERDGSGARAATWFDVLTAAAFLACAEARVEVAVVECGLGGRLDSTNVVHGIVAGVTNVYLEHTAILGSTRAAIAAEKAGIVKPGARAVVGALGPDDEAAAVVAAVARARGAAVARVEYAPSASLAERNRAFARAALAELDAARPDLALRSGVPLAERLGPGGELPGRAERRSVRGRALVLDGAHVPESLALLMRDLARDAGLPGRPVVVLGMGLEKDATGLLKALLGRVDRVLCSSVGEGPYRDAAELAGLARALGLAAEAVPAPAAALDEALRLAGTGGWVLVTGSLHLVGAVSAHAR
jgi:dihydrofolate synthase/folylpolyglutamate synthase